VVGVSSFWGINLLSLLTEPYRVHCEYPTRTGSGQAFSYRGFFFSGACFWGRMQNRFALRCMYLTTP
jgi:hypothetical protein